jgi:hypothetical protein
VDNAPQLPNPVLGARTNLDLEYEYVETRFSGVELETILGNIADGGWWTDEAKCHVYKRVERQLRSGAGQRDNERKMFVLRNPLLARESLVSKVLVGGG